MRLSLFLRRETRASRGPAGRPREWPSEPPSADDLHGELADRGDDRADEAAQNPLPARDGDFDDVVRQERDVFGLALVDGLHVDEDLAAARPVRLLADDAHL